ncbi:hypothetical protein [Cupriavidus sp. D384]|uniref:hypothetical protein n=1 Tax=Cupriavidus sp. D384 TaxID=1538095 RepID=UPI000B16AFA0|nr:hypothetical protein [Cupriavidus sp. D384]
MAAATQHDVLYELDRVREAGCGRYRACCPLCNLYRRTVSIRETSEGRMYMHCWRCGADEGLIVAVLARRRRALGLPRQWWREPPRYAYEPIPVGER